MNVALITNPEELRGQQLGDTLCNPVQDANENWIISMIEAAYLPADSYEVITWNPREIEE